MTSLGTSLTTSWVMTTSWGTSRTTSLSTTTSFSTTWGVGTGAAGPQATASRAIRARAGRISRIGWIKERICFYLRKAEKITGRRRDGKSAASVEPARLPRFILMDD